MNVKYDAEADVLIFVMKDAPPCDAIAEPGGVIVSHQYAATNQTLPQQFSFW